MKQGFREGLQAAQAKLVCFVEHIAAAPGAYMRRSQVQQGFFYGVQQLHLLPHPRSLC